MGSRSSIYSALSGGLFLIGLGLIFLLKLPFFPAILAIVGASSILAGFATGRGWHGLQGGIWLIGLFFLFYFDIFFPGILILIGVSMLVGAMTRPLLRSEPEVEHPEKEEK